jgi:hypothetical protein
MSENRLFAADGIVKQGFFVLEFLRSRARFEHLV